MGFRARFDIQILYMDIDDPEGPLEDFLKLCRSGRDGIW